MKKRMAFATVNALMAIFALASFPTIAQAGDPPPGESHPIYSAEQTELADAEVIAKMQEVTTDRALARIRSQKLISELSESLQSQNTLALGGIWIVNAQDSVLHFALKNLPGTKEADSLKSVKDQVSAKLQNDSGIDRIEYHVVAFSLDELNQAQALLTKLIERNNWTLLTYIDTTTNSIHIHGIKETLAQVDASIDKSQLPVPVDEDSGKSIFTFVETSQPPISRAETEVCDDSVS